jgi:hypothetical protein
VVVIVVVLDVVVLLVDANLDVVVVSIEKPDGLVLIVLVLLEEGGRCDNVPIVLVDPLLVPAGRTGVEVAAQTTLLGVG